MHLHQIFARYIRRYMKQQAQRPIHSATMRRNLRQTSSIFYYLYSKNIAIILLIKSTKILFKTLYHFMGIQVPAIDQYRFSPL